MQRIIKNNEVVDETWHLLPKDATFDGISNCDDLIVPLALWREHGHALKARDGGLGVWLDADEEAEEIGDDVAHFQVIALNFPAFTDGRNYSNARLLRDRYGYKGELRAIGDVLRDQLFYLHRCGFDAFALRADKDPYEALESLKDFSGDVPGCNGRAAAAVPSPLSVSIVKSPGMPGLFYTSILIDASTCFCSMEHGTPSGCARTAAITPSNCALLCANCACIPSICCTLRSNASISASRLCSPGAGISALSSCKVNPACWALWISCRVCRASGA